MPVSMWYCDQQQWLASLGDALRSSSRHSVVTNFLFLHAYTFVSVACKWWPAATVSIALRILWQPLSFIVCCNFPSRSCIYLISAHMPVPVRHTELCPASVGLTYIVRRSSPHLLERASFIFISVAHMLTASASTLVQHARLTHRKRSDTLSAKTCQLGMLVAFGMPLHPS